MGAVFLFSLRPFGPQLQNKILPQTANKKEVNQV